MNPEHAAAAQADVNELIHFGMDADALDGMAREWAERGADYLEHSMTAPDEARQQLVAAVAWHDEMTHWLSRVAAGMREEADDDGGPDVV